MIRVYDPAMCCSTGVCGPSVDPELTRVASAIFILEGKGIDIKRFNLGAEPQEFIEESKVQSLLNERGTEALPVILVDGEVHMTGRYPTNEEFAEWTGLSVDDFTKKRDPLKGIKLL
ncbi:arsenite efflux transporter metallochaperone ArsD [Bacillus solitudinis]|uniref:arsenite efflux transporter metallochaperone ArsD n=1 Tax=Bacillus solitudinis TaxID=2014074 RepID=UPI000C246085|nr:arsenite efflux transporter metallochaperone ArsD [Bacillus solitudinis]